jgi:hypothetical protein
VAIDIRTQQSVAGPQHPLRTRRSKGKGKELELVDLRPEIETGMQLLMSLRCSKKHFLIVFPQLEQQDSQTPVRP